MCGIAGIVQFEREWDCDELSRHLKSMADTLAHRGPDGEGIWVSADSAVGFAHRRLSIIDLSPAGAQPMWSHDRRYCITFNGEIYNYQELREELRAKSAQFYTDSDTEVLIETYRAYGVAGLERLDGMFAFALYDVVAGDLLLARDPFGEKPFYYALTAKRLTFASELDALRAVPGFDDTMVPDAMAGYLCLQYFDGEATPFRAASKLRPGHFARLHKGGQFEIRRYFEFSPAGELNNRSSDDWADELEALLTTSLSRRLRADVPVGAFLSGGIDSSTVVALASRKLGIPLKTFTIGFNGFSGSEHTEAAQIAAHLGVEHHVRMLGPEALALADRLGALVDEPNGDTSLLPTYLLSEFAREQVKVALSGDGADELFGGYGRYMQTLTEERLIGDPGSAGRRYYSNRVLVLNEHEVSRLFAGKATGLHERLHRLRDEIDLRPGDLLARLRKTDVEHYMPGAVLAKVDRMSMRHGLEVRTPFLSIPIARFAERLPEKLLVSGDAGKLLLKQVASRYIPRSWLDRPKRGFGLPPYRWAGKALQAHVRGSFVTQRDRNAWWADRCGMEAWLDTCTTHGDNSDYKLWNIQHIQGFLGEKGGVPPVVFDPVMAGSLRTAHRAKDGRTIGLAACAQIGWRSLFPQLDLVVSLWPGAKDGALACDWLRDPAEAVGTAAERMGGPVQCVVLLDRGGCDTGLESALRGCGVRWLLEYQADRWIRRSLIGPSAGAVTPKPALIFDPIEQLPRRFERAEVLIQLRRRILPGPPPKLIGAAELFGPGPSLMRPDTPARARQLVAELAAWTRFRFREKHLLAKIVRWCREGVVASTPGGAKRVALIISDLGSGGAERQLCNLAGALQARGHTVRLFTLNPLQGGAAHYASLLERNGVELVNGSEVYEPFIQGAGSPDQLAVAAELIGQLPTYVRRYVWPLFSHMASWKPDVAIAYLDYPNIVGGLASLLARTPKVVVSFRNHSPDHFGFYQSWFRRYYRTLVATGRVLLTGNSEAGNRSYAKWLGIPEKRVVVVRNGVDFATVRIPEESEVAAIREEFALVGNRVIVGVFRLSSEKRPELFLRVVQEVLRVRTDVKVLILGEGPERGRLQEAIERAGLQNAVRLVGRRNNVAAFMRAADVVLQTAWLEGTPNSLLEAQYLQVPVVTTAAGGAAEAVHHGSSGFVFDSDDPGLFARAVVGLLCDPTAAAAMGTYGRQFVTERFELHKLFISTMRLIEDGAVDIGTSASMAAHWTDRDSKI